MATLTVSPNPIPQNSEITCEFHGFMHSEPVYIGVVGGGHLTTTADSLGAGIVTFSLSEAPGNYTMEAADDVGNYATVPFLVSPAGWMQVASKPVILILTDIPAVINWVEVDAMGYSMTLTTGLPTTGWVQVAVRPVVLELTTGTPVVGWVQVARVSSNLSKIYEEEEEEGETNLSPVLIIGGAALVGLALAGENKNMTKKK
jgi:hypothetical protein